MICNAGFGYYGTVEDTPPDVMQRMMDVNFMGTFYGARAALPLFRAQGSGHLIFISSIVGRRGIALMGGYSATKAAQVGLAESLRTEFSGTGIHVSVRLPGLDGDRVPLRDGARLRPLGRPASDRSSPWTTSRGRWWRACEQPRAEVYPHAQSRALAVAQRRRAGFTDRLVRKYGRAPRGPVTCRRCSTDALRRSFDLAAGDRARASQTPAAARSIVGGWVRDRLMGRRRKDVDIEVYGLDADRAEGAARRDSAP